MATAVSTSIHKPKDLLAARKTGQSLRLVLRTRSESEDGCGDIVSRILELGELISPKCGLVNVRLRIHLCSSFTVLASRGII
jgi:hypothetical protein